MAGTTGALPSSTAQLASYADQVTRSRSGSSNACTTSLDAILFDGAPPTKQASPSELSTVSSSATRVSLADAREKLHKAISQCATPSRPVSDKVGGYDPTVKKDYLEACDTVLRLAQDPANKEKIKVDEFGVANVLQDVQVSKDTTLKKDSIVHLDQQNYDIRNPTADPHFWGDSIVFKKTEKGFTSSSESTLDYSNDRMQGTLERGSFALSKGIVYEKCHIDSTVVDTNDNVTKRDKRDSNGPNDDSLLWKAVNVIGGGAGACASTPATTVVVTNRPGGSNTVAVQSYEDHGYGHVSSNNVIVQGYGANSNVIIQGNGPVIVQNHSRY